MRIHGGLIGAIVVLSLGCFGGSGEPTLDDVLATYTGPSLAVPSVYNLPTEEDFMAGSKANLKAAEKRAIELFGMTDLANLSPEMVRIFATMKCDMAIDILMAYHRDKTAFKCYADGRTPSDWQWCHGTALIRNSGVPEFDVLSPKYIGIDDMFKDQKNLNLYCKVCPRNFKLFEAGKDLCRDWKPNQ
tara:strand:+ start:3166 stop:3729 length:564 start_codon:yes stop_codon:yes gene_type:complete